MSGARKELRMYAKIELKRRRLLIAAAASLAAAIDARLAPLLEGAKRP